MLRLHHVANPSRAIWLLAPGVSIGASPGCDLVLCEAGIAARQVEIDIQGENLKMTLLSDSVNTCVNDEAVTRGIPIKLCSGDRLRIGSVELQVIDPQQWRPALKISPLQLATGNEGTDWILKPNKNAHGLTSAAGRAATAACVDGASKSKPAADASRNSENNSRHAPVTSIRAMPSTARILAVGLGCLAILAAGVFFAWR